MKGEISGVTFSQPITLRADAHEIATFSPDRFTQLAIRNPKLWWPAQVGPQNLYNLNLRFETGGSVSDTSTIDFGIREIQSELPPGSSTGENAGGVAHQARSSRLFEINGKNILIRGAGYSFDMLLREDEKILNARSSS